MGTYKKTSHSVPALSKSHTFSAPGTQYSGWSGFGPIEPPETLWFLIPMDFTLSMDFNKHDFIAATAAVQFGDEDSNVIYTASLGYIQDPLSFGGSSSISALPPGILFSTATQCRLALGFTGYPLENVAVNASVSGGKIDVYEYVEELAADVAAESDNGSDLPRHHVFSAGKAGREITKIRYRFNQTAENAGAWSGTPIGTAILRKYT